MRKVPTLFERDWEGDRSRVTETVVEECAWVLEGEGKATVKYDGTCMYFDGGGWWARREVRAGKEAPAGFVGPLERDEKTGKMVGWEPVAQSPFARFHAEAVRVGGEFEPGTYELIGPKVQGNPEGVERHLLVPHASATVIHVAERTYEGIRRVLEGLDVEGLVFHHPDGRMAKIKKRDYGMRR